MVSNDEATLGAELHARLMAGDPFASQDVFERYYRRLVRILGGTGRSRDPDLLEEAASEALRSYLTRPDRYDPTRKGLLGFLVMAAERDLLNLIQRERNASRLRVVELDEADRNRGDEDAVGDEIADAEVAARRRAALLAEAEDDEERIVLGLMMDGERQTTIFAAALGLTDRSVTAQREHVNRVKDRLIKRFRRLQSRRVADDE